MLTHCLCYKLVALQKQDRHAESVELTAALLESGSSRPALQARSLVTLYEEELDNGEEAIADQYMLKLEQLLAEQGAVLQRDAGYVSALRRLASIRLDQEQEDQALN